MDRADADSNEGLATKLEELDRLQSPHIIEAFRHVDRGFFIPQEHRAEIYQDRPFRQPLKEGALHMSAPHMYAVLLEEMDMSPGSGHSFLNVGSGTGYLSTLAAFLVGPEGSVHGVEVFADVVQWSKDRFAEFAATPLIPGFAHHGVARDSLARDIKFVVGNAFSIDVSRNCKYDRIYIGAQGKREDLSFFVKLLAPGGVLLGPFDDQLLRVKCTGDGQKYSVEPLMGVRFAELVRPRGDSSLLIQKPAEDIRREKIAKLCSACNVQEVLAATLLQENQWDVDKATAAHKAALADAESLAKQAKSNRSVSEGVPPTDNEATIDEWLRTYKLNRYVEAVKEAGYDEIIFLRDADEPEIDELVEDAKMKKPHAKTFRRAWRELVSESAAVNSEPQTMLSPSTSGTQPKEVVVGHGSASVHEPVPAAAQQQAVDPSKRLFGSMRFRNGRLMSEAVQLQTSLSQIGLELKIVDMSAGGDIDTEVFGGIESADTFIVFGTADYGQDTGNSASTFYESKFAMFNKKRMILLRMLRPGQKFEHLQARQLFGVNKLCLEWVEGEPMPSTLVSDIVKAIESAR